MLHYFACNMIRLAEKLLALQAKTEHLDYYERVLFSHVLACYEPEQGMCCCCTPMSIGTNCQKLAVRAKLALAFSNGVLL